MATSSPAGSPGTSRVTGPVPDPRAKHALDDRAREGMTFVGRFPRDDPAARAQFDHAFGTFVAKFHQSWDVQVVLGALAQITEATGEAHVLMVRQPSGRLSVTITAALAPHEETSTTGDAESTEEHQ